MANNIQIGAVLGVSGDGVQAQLSRQFGFPQVGSKWINQKQSIGTSPETLSTLDLANLRYASIYNPTGSGGTITVTAAPIVLVPGDAMIFPPSSLLVTLQANVTATEIAAAGVEA